MNSQPQKSLQEQLKDSSVSSLQRYQQLAVGSSSLWYLFKYELITMLCSWVPGALGYALRKLTYPWILQEVGRGVIFGRNVVVRHGMKIRIGDAVTLDDNVVLDAKGETNNGLSIGQGTIVSRNTILSCKNGDISVGERCTLGINSLLHSTPGSDVEIGDDVLCGAYCYFIGGGVYASDQLEVPFKQQGAVSQGGIKVANNVWFGSNVQILDGVTIGTGTIIGTSAVVNKSVADYDIVAGVPAKVIRNRRDKPPG